MPEPTFQRKRRRRAAGEASTPGAARGGGLENEDVYEGPEGRVEKRRRRLSVPELRLPTFKHGFTPAPLTLPKKTDQARANTQRQIWERAASEGQGLDTRLTNKLHDEQAPRMVRESRPIFFLKLRRETNYVLGERSAVKQRSLRPFWTSQGSRRLYDVDHKRELQLGGANELGNLWLLDSEANQSSGRNIRTERNRVIQRTLDAAAAAGLWRTGPPSLDTVRRSYTIEVQRVSPGLPVAGEPSQTWTIEQVRDQGLPLDGLEVLSKTQVEEAGLEGSASELVIYTSETGGGIRRVPWGEGMTEKSVSIPFGPAFAIETVRYTQGQGGSVTGRAFRDQPAGGRLFAPTVLDPFELRESDAVDWGGFISAASVTRSARSALKADGLSPVRIDAAELADDGLHARGVIQATVPPIGGTEIDLTIDGTGVTLSKTFSAGELSIPGPVRMTGGSLTLAGGTRGLEIAGEVRFEIPRVGEGFLRGEAGTSTGFAVEGALTLTPELFDPPSEVRVAYRDGHFSGSGQLTMGQSRRLKGIRRASIRVEADEERWTATGTVEPDIPAVESGSLTVTIDREQGLTVAGDLTFGQVPGLESGSLHAEIREEGEGWIVSGSGTARLALPGIDAGVEASFRDGAFSVQGTVGYRRGFASGEVTAGVTNLPVDEATGRPATGGEPTPDVRPFGSGSLTLRIAPWLQGTVGVRVTPAAELEVTGRVALPSALDVFPQKAVEKELVSIGIDIPIVGVAVAGQRIGIFATINGSLTAHASIGPGQLRDLAIEVTYNPSREEDTRVTGSAAFVVPADAGLRLAVRAGLGAGIPVVSASLGLELGGELGIEGEARAAVQVEWSPTTGIELHAEGRLQATPVFRFDVSGYALVEADLLFTTVELYSQRWQLAALQVGSGLTLGARFPIDYRDGEPFDISLDDVTFIVPDIDTTALLRQLVSRIT